VIYNDIYSDLCIEEGDPADTISALSFRLRRYNQTEYLAEALSVTSPQTATTWGTIAASDLVSYRYYNTTTFPTNSTTYSINISFTDGASANASYAATVPPDTWLDIFDDIVTDINTQGWASANYDNTLQSVFIGNGTKTISGIIITSDNSDTAIVTPTQTTSTFVNDVYVVEVAYTVGGVDYTRDYYLPVYCSIKQCILRLIGRIPELENCNSCNDDCIGYIIEASGLMLSLEVKEINNTEDITEAQDVISKLEAICDDEDCQCY